MSEHPFDEHVFDVRSFRSAHMFVEQAIGVKHPQPDVIGVGRCAAAARHVLPLRLSREAIAMSGLGRQPREVGLEVVGTEAGRGMLWGDVVAGRFPVRLGIGLPGAVGEHEAGGIVAARVLGERRELRDRDFDASDRKRMADPHLVLGAFSGGAVGAQLRGGALGRRGLDLAVHQHRHHPEELLVLGDVEQHRMVRAAIGGPGQAHGGEGGAVGIEAVERAGGTPAPRAAMPMRSPEPAALMGAAKLAAPAIDRATMDTARDRRDARTPLPVAEWIALIRKLRDEGRDDEAAKELTAFRNLHPDHEQLLPPDLSRWQPSAK